MNIKPIIPMTNTKATLRRHHGERFAVSDLGSCIITSFNYASQWIQSTGQVSIASSIHCSDPPSGMMTNAFSSVSSMPNTSGHSSTQLSQPIHSYVSMNTFLFKLNPPLLKIAKFLSGVFQDQKYKIHAHSKDAL